MSTKTGAQRTTGEGKAETPCSTAGRTSCTSRANARSIEALAGNFAMQRFVQAHLRVGRPDDPQEVEADRVASTLGPASCGGCGASAPCAACADKRPRISRKPAAGSPSHTPAVPAAQLARLAGGSSLDSATRTRMQQFFGRDLARVRIHTGAQAAESARGINARAFTTGSDIVFDRGEYRPGTVDGDRLLAHELTHVVQNGGEESPIRRVVNGDVRTMSITEPWARDLTNAELTEQLEIVNGELSRNAAATPEHQTASDNLGVLQTEYRRRNPDSPVPGQVVPRPPGLPLQGGYQLVPLQLPSDVAAQIPDGQLVNLDSVGGGGTGIAPGAPASAGIGPGSYVTDRPSTAATSVAAGTWSGLRTNLSTYGFEAAGSDAIGLVAFPRYAPGRFLQGMSSLVPEHPVLWGHTAVYVRQGGRIVSVRSYAPASLLEAGLTPGVEAGTAGVPASIYNESGVIDIFNVSNARSMEWAVPADQAAAFAEGLPEGATYGFGDAMEGAMYTARPGACVGTNCIGWAMPQAEGQLGTIAAADTPGASIGSQTQFSQGRLIRFMRAAQENPDTVAAIQGAEGDLPMVAGSLSRGMQVLKWGGRVMLVVAVVSIPVEVALAKPEERTRTAVGATAGFLGGLGAGAIAGLACGPGAPVCSVILGIGFGVVGAFGARKLAEATYDAATNPSVSDEDRPQCPGVANCHRANRRRDPWLLPAVQGEGLFGRRYSPFAHTRPQQRMLSDADVAAIMQFIYATPSQNQSPANQPASH